MPAFHVRIAGDDLGFSAAHFLIFADGRCESLHGHNYRVAAEVWGPLDDDQCVVDFGSLAERLRAVLAELDHAVLLPARSPALRVTAGPEEVEATLAGDPQGGQPPEAGQQPNAGRWVFPRRDCRVLPLAATTAELWPSTSAAACWKTSAPGPFAGRGGSASKSRRWPAGKRRGKPGMKDRGRSRLRPPFPSHLRSRKRS